MVRSLGRQCKGQSSTCYDSFVGFPELLESHGLSFRHLTAEVSQMTRAARRPINQLQGTVLSARLTLTPAALQEHSSVVCPHQPHVDETQ